MILSSPGAVAFSILGFPIYYYGIIMALAIFTGYFVAYYAGEKYWKINVENFFLPLVLTGFLGARLYYCLLSWDYYGVNLLQVFNFRGGGLSIHGGIITATLFLLVYSKVKKFSLWQISAPLCLGLPLAQCIGRWGNFFNSEAFGKPFDGFIKLYIPEYLRPTEFSQFQYFHPTFLYESIADLLIFFVLILVLKRTHNPKFITCFYLMMYSIIRIIIEFLRIDSTFSPFGIPIAVIVSAIILLFSIISLLFNKRP